MVLYLWIIPVILTGLGMIGLGILESVMSDGPNPGKPMAEGIVMATFLGAYIGFGIVERLTDLGNTQRTEGQWFFRIQFWCSLLILLSMQVLWMYILGWSALKLYTNVFQHTIFIMQ